MPAQSYQLSSPVSLSGDAGYRSETNVSVEDLRQQLVGTNINEQTFLATDYLNHFNEIVMLIEMLPSMPECFEDIAMWQPKTYEDHFSDSGFKDKELAILAFQWAPELVRKRFDEVITTLDRSLIDAIEAFKETFEMEAPEHLTLLSEKLTVELRQHIDQASAIINGSNTTLTTDDGTVEVSTQRDSIEKTQAAVAELFND